MCVMGVLFIMAVANAQELIEWSYAVIDGGDVGLAFLGSQVDVQDAQKDMLADTLGAILGSGLFVLLNSKKKISQYIIASRNNIFPL